MVDGAGDDGPTPVGDGEPERGADGDGVGRDGGTGGIDVGASTATIRGVAGTLAPAAVAPGVAAACVDADADADTLALAVTVGLDGVPLASGKPPTAGASALSQISPNPAIAIRPSAAGSACSRAAAAFNDGR